MDTTWYADGYHADFEANYFYTAKKEPCAHYNYQEVSSVAVTGVVHVTPQSVD